MSKPILATRRARVVVAAAFAAFLGACAAPAFVPGSSTEAAVRAGLGEPAAVYPLTGGAKRLAFPTGPMGTQTFMADIGADGKLVRLEQVLTEAHFLQVRKGEDGRDAVLRLLGPPWRSVDFPNKRQVAWDYRFRDTWGYLADFSVIFDDKGIAVETVTVRQEIGRQFGS